MLWIWKCQYANIVNIFSLAPSALQFSQVRLAGRLVALSLRLSHWDSPIESHWKEAVLFGPIRPCSALFGSFRVSFQAPFEALSEALFAALSEALFAAPFEPGHTLSHIKPSIWSPLDYLERERKRQRKWYRTNHTLSISRFCQAQVPLINQLTPL